MTLQGANNFFENDVFILYTVNSSQTGQYCVVVPKIFGSAVSMLVDINKKTLFDSLINGSITKEELVLKIKEEYEILSTDYSGSILVFPMLDINVFTSIVNASDKQKMFDETKKIGGITSELYKSLTESNVDKSKVSQKIVIVENNEVDVKYVEWLKVQMPNFVDGISLEEFKNKINVATNPFASVNPFTGDVVAQPQPVNDIFCSSSLGEAVVAEKKDDKFDIFAGQPQPSVGQSEGVEVATTQPEVSSSLDSNVAITNPFEPQAVVGVSLNSSPASVDTSNPSLDNSQSFQSNVASVQQAQPVVNSDAPVVLQQEEVSDSSGNGKSSGFANLLILVVILIGVTIVSIELGKYLYNTFGV